MPGLSLVTGAPRSGKTSHLLDLAAARFAADPFAGCLVLVPTARHADQFRRRLVQRTGAAFGLDVTTFNLFARRHVAAADIAAGDLGRELLDRVIEECVAGEGAAARFRPIRGTAGLLQLVLDAVSELITEQVGPEDFRAAAVATGDLDLAALAEIFGAYREALAERGWATPREVPSLAARALQKAAGVPGLPPMVLVDGAQFFTRGEIALLAALAQHAEVTVTLDATAGPRAAWSVEALRDAVPGLVERAAGATPEPGTYEAYTASDDEAQLREIARSIKARLAEDPALRPSDFAVTFRRVAQHLALARRVFAELELPLDPAAGERLAERPLGAWLLRFLRVGAHGWRTEDLVHALRSGFVRRGRWDLRPVDLERLLAAARGHSLWADLERLEALPAAVEEDLATRPRANAEEYRAAAMNWLRMLGDLAPALDPAATRTAGEHARLIDDLLFGADGCVREDIDAYPTLDLEAEALRRDLRAFVALDEALGAGSVAFEAFLALLEARMQRPATMLREAGGVLLAPMHTLHGLRFEHVYAAGLVEGEFPAPQRAAALLDGRRRAALADAGLPLPPEARSTEDELWHTATSRGERMTSLWRPRLAGSRPAAASYYFEATAPSPVHIERAARPERSASPRELAIALASGWPSERRRPAGFQAWGRVVRVAAPVEQRRRSFEPAGPYEGVLEGADFTQFGDPERLWSPTGLESYRTCRFQFFSSYALNLRQLDEEATQADAAKRGTVMHEILEDAVRPLIEREVALNADTVEETVARLRASGPGIWNSAPERHAFGRAALWRYEGRQALDQLEGMVRREAAQSDALGLTGVAGVEQKFAANLEGVEPPLQVRGYADRVDSGPGIIQIVDYKTGAPIERRAVEEGRRLQLQLYALAARQHWGDVRLIARYAFLRPPKEEWWLDSARAGDQAILDDTAAVAQEIRDEVQSGAFEVMPQDGTCPSYCSFKHACRVHHLSRFKSWR